MNSLKCFYNKPLQLLFEKKRSWGEKEVASCFFVCCTHTIKNFTVYTLSFLCRREIDICPQKASSVCMTISPWRFSQNGWQCGISWKPSQKFTEPDHLCVFSLPFLADFPPLGGSAPSGIHNTLFVWDPQPRLLAVFSYLAPLFLWLRMRVFN